MKRGSAAADVKLAQSLVGTRPELTVVERPLEPDPGKTTALAFLSILSWSDSCRRLLSGAGIDTSAPQWDKSPTTLRSVGHFLAKASLALESAARQAEVKPAETRS